MRQRANMSRRVVLVQLKTTNTESKISVRKQRLCGAVLLSNLSDARGCCFSIRIDSHQWEGGTLTHASGYFERTKGQASN